MWLYQDLEGWNSPGIWCCWRWKWEAPKSQFTKVQLVKTLAAKRTFTSPPSTLPFLCVLPQWKCLFFSFFKIPLSPKNWKRLTLDLSWLRKWPFSQLQSCVPDAFSSGGNKSHPPILSTSNALYKLTWQVAERTSNYDYFLDEELEAAWLIKRQQCPLCPSVSPHFRQHSETTGYVTTLF